MSTSIAEALRQIEERVNKKYPLTKLTKTNPQEEASPTQTTGTLHSINKEEDAE